MFVSGILSASLATAATSTAPICAGKALRPATVLSMEPRGRVKALVIFARFRDESGDASVPAWAHDLFDPSLPGSLRHYFAEMSRQQFILDGEGLPKIY